MRSYYLLIGLVASMFLWTSCNKTDASRLTQTTTKTENIVQMDDTSYSIGMLMAQNLASQGIKELDQTSFQEGMNAVLAGKETKLTMEQATANFQNAMTAAKEKMVEANKAEGQAYLDKNGQRPGVTTTASGLQYEVLEASDSKQMPSLTDKVNVHYHGTLTDGTVFDSSVERGEPISFPVNGVIQGWQEGLQLMSVGSKYRFYIPYDLAYGERGAGATIGPYAALIFDVTLLGIE